MSNWSEVYSRFFLKKALILCQYAEEINIKLYDQIYANRFYSV